MRSPLNKYIKTVEKTVKVDDGVPEKQKNSAFILVVCLFIALVIFFWGLLNCHG